jgi:hypothetical protein
VTGDREQVDAERADVDGYLADGLRRVGVDERSIPAGGLGCRLDGLQDACLVVGMA